MNKTIEFLEFVSEKIIKFATSDIVIMTGCLPNCVYFKYDLAKIQEWTVNIPGVKSLFSLSEIFGKILFFLDLHVQWLDQQVAFVQEKLAYDGLTFVANFGGTLGLFLGFSFFMIWDWILPFVVKIFEVLKFNKRKP